MSRKRDKDDLQRTLRASGLRKKVAQTVTRAAGRSPRGKQSKLLDRTIENLRAAAAEIEQRAGRTMRSEAAKKAARTRKSKAAARSKAALKAARTRARTGA
jgi:rubrerythrin